MGSDIISTTYAHAMNSSVEQKHPKFSTFEFGNEFDDGDFETMNLELD